MHEVSIMQNTLDIAIAQARQNGAKKIDCLTLKIGELSGVIPEALEFAFDVLIQGTIAENARLEIKIERIQIEQERHKDSDCFNFGVIVGDLATDNDAKRLQNRQIPAIQITTGNACHLEADMVAKAASKLNLNSLDLLIIENVGNFSRSQNRRSLKLGILCYFFAQFSLVFILILRQPT